MQRCLAVVALVVAAPGRLLTTPRFWAVCCGVVIVAGTLEAAQTPPNRSGTWTTVRGSSEGRGNRSDNQLGGGGLRIGPAPASLVIAQDARTMTVVERYSSWPDNKVEYRFDSQMVRNPFLMTPNFVPSEVTSRWEKDKLVSAIVLFVPGQSEPRRYQQTMWLDTKGFLLVRIEDSSSNSRTVSFRKQEVR